MPTMVQVPVAEVFAKVDRGPAERTLRTKQLEEDAKHLSEQITSETAIEIDYSDWPEPKAYLSGLRAALNRLGFRDVLLQKHRGSDTARAWLARPEDEQRIYSKKVRGAELGARQRGKSKPRKAKAEAEFVPEAQAEIQTHEPYEPTQFEDGRARAQHRRERELTGV